MSSDPHGRARSPAASGSDAGAAGERDGDDGRAATGRDGDAEPTAEATACAHTDYVEGDAPEAFPKTGAGAEGVEADVWDALYGIDDPEMPVSIVDLGLIYGVEVTDGRAAVAMTLTYTGCPARKYLTENVEAAVGAVEGVEEVALDLVWNPPWTLDMVTERGHRDLREFGLSV